MLGVQAMSLSTYEELAREEVVQGLLHAPSDTGAGIVRERSFSSDGSEESQLSTDRSHRRRRGDEESDEGDAMGDLDSEDRHADSSKSREITVRMLYWGCLFVVVANLGAYCVLGSINITSSSKSASELNAGGRRRYLAERIHHLARELLLTDGVTSQRDSAIASMNTTDVVRCQLKRSIEGMTSIHYASIYGQTIGWEDIPDSRGYPRPTAEEECSPLTWDAMVFEDATRTPGSLHRFHEQEMCLFHPNCLTSLPFGKSSISLTNERIQFFSLAYSPTKCSYFQQGDPVVSYGLHTMVEAMLEKYDVIASVDMGSLSEGDTAYNFVSKYHDTSPEWAMGLVKSILIYQEEALQKLAFNNVLMGVAFAVTSLALFFQLTVLGSQIEVLLRQNLGMRIIMKRMLISATRTTFKDNRDEAILARLHHDLTRDDFAATDNGAASQLF
jgi:hypothetical protein